MYETLMKYIVNLSRSKVDLLNEIVYRDNWQMSRRCGISYTRDVLVYLAR